MLAIDTVFLFKMVGLLPSYFIGTDNDTTTENQIA
jgi:hypothetical protein